MLLSQRNWSEFYLYKAQMFFSGRMAEGLRSGPPNTIKRKAKNGSNSISNNLYPIL